MISIETDNTLLAEQYPAAARFHGGARGSITRAPADIPAEEVLAELARVVASPDFPASERNRRVLHYVVQCSLEGREQEAGAYHIATRVYGRPQTFDALKDPIVRIEMARLRRDLELYYLKGGARNPLRIDIPRGCYVPRVTRAARPAAASRTDAPAPSPFLVSVLRCSLRAWSGAGDAAAAWQDLLLADPDLPANLQTSVAREVGDDEVAALLVEGLLRAARRTA